eukprot:TRINITY_DN10622_c0_g1_i1.p1 TRINITY_DN10622_c0_g1~~TRINITY_DN10622_c0_g1_i1.p1  ORF type:complete len:194 (-),score=67.00 TRINITY_DN10622_c0_g1_i1:145-726(-)
MVFLHPLPFLLLGISSINCAPQFSAQLKPFFNFGGFNVLAHNGRDAFNAIDVRARAPKPSNAALRIEPVVASTTTPPPPTTTARPTASAAPSTTTTAPPPTTTTPPLTTATNPPTTTTVQIKTTTAASTNAVKIEDDQENSAESIKDLQDVSDETLDKLIVLDPIAFGETISVNDEPQQDGMNIVDFDSESLI